MNKSFKKPVKQRYRWQWFLLGVGRITAEFDSQAKDIRNKIDLNKDE